MEHLAVITQEEANSLRKKEVAGKLLAACAVYIES